VPCAEPGALFYDIERGISPGCPLSPLMGTLFLQTSDERMEQLGLLQYQSVNGSGRRV